MPRVDRLQLLHGPYRPPRARPGRELFCEVRGYVRVGGWLDGPVPWRCAEKQQGYSDVLCGHLVRAVRLEVAAAAITRRL